MAWLACDANGAEWIYSGEPYRDYDETWQSHIGESNILLPTGTIEKLIGRPLTWSDEPVEL